MNSFSSRAQLTSGNRTYSIYRLPALEARGFNLSRLPFSLKILLENLLRREDAINVTAADIEFLANWDAKAEPSREIAYMPARVLMQDFTGVPAVVDLGAMRDAIKTLGGDPERVNPLVPAELVIDHSVQVDEYGAAGALDANTLLEFQRNRERYAFLKWGQTAFRNFSAVPPGMGICHQVNLEYLARVVFTTEIAGELVAYPDTLGGHRLAHHHDQRPGRVGLGRGRHRGRGGHAGPAGFHADSAGGGLQTDRQTARGRHCDGLGVDRDPGAAQARRCRQIRRILWRRHNAVTAGRSGHHQQHGPRVRRHLRHLPGGRRNPALPAPDRPQRRADCAGRGLLPGAGTLSYCRDAGGRVHPGAGTGFGHRGAERGRAQAPPGPRIAQRCSGQLCAAVACSARADRQAAGHPHRGGVGAGSSHRRGRGGDLALAPDQHGEGAASASIPTSIWTTDRW